jgi:hypothetical protein
MMKVRALIATLTVPLLSACGSPEQAAIDQYFRAAQSNDSTTLSYMSDVSSPIDVGSWKVVEVSSRTTEPFMFSEVAQKFEAAKKERDAATEKRTKFGKDNKDALEQIIPKLRDDPEYKFKGKLAEVQEEWTKQLEERKVTEQNFQELRRQVNEESNIAGKSVMRQGVDLAKMRGNIAVSELLVNLTPKEGGAALPYKVTLRKYDLSEGDSDRTEPARWVIANIEGATPEARAAAEAKKKPATHAAAESAPAAPAGGTEVAAKPAPEAAAESAPHESGYTPRELHGAAKVQILAPETKLAGSDVVTVIRVRNSSRDWITGLEVTEHWYDKNGSAVRSHSVTHRERLMPGAVAELQLRTPKSADFYQNQYEFKHANGTVTATTVGSFPK